MSLHLVILDRGHSPTSIAGVHRIARLVNSARQAGIDRITVATDLDEAAVGEIASSLPGDKSSPRFQTVRPSDTTDKLATDGASDHVAFVDTGVLANADFFTFLRSSWDGRDKPLRIRVPHYGHLYWSIPWSQSHLLRDVNLADVTDHFSRLYPNGHIPEAAPPPESFVDVSRVSQERHAVRWLLKQSVKATDGMVSRLLNRPVSTRITRLLIPLGVRPVHFTGLVALGMLGMLALLVSGDPFLLAAGCVLYHVLSVLDGTDGELARVKLQSTDWGARLDTAVDMATNLFFVIGVNVGLVRIYGEQYATLGQALVAGAVLYILLMMLLVRFGPGGGSFDILGEAIDRRVGRFAWSRSIATARQLFKRDFYAFFFAVLGVLGLARLIPWFILLGLVSLLVAIGLNASYILRSRAQDILPQHILDH